MDNVRFDGQVAIVTGAGGGLGREYALALANRGARVVVNDLGGGVDGQGASLAAARDVVAEIEAAGGEALANGASVTDAQAVQALVDEVMARWGRIDVLIANAGILRDKSFSKMTREDFSRVVDVHLMGAFNPIKAVWDIMKAQGYGRIVVATSGTGLFGNFGQANYGAAKLALVGLMNTLKIEGAKNDIRINAISPVAATRMTDNIMPPEMLAKFAPEHVTPGVVYLASKDAPNGAILTAGAGVFALSQIVETEGAHLGETTSAEAVRDRWAEIADAAGAEPYTSGAGQTQKFLRKSAS